MASHRLLRRSRAARFGMLRALGLKVAAFFGIRGLLRHRNRFLAQSHGLSWQFKPRLRYRTMLKGLRGIAGCLTFELDSRYWRFDHRSAAAHDLRNQPRYIHAGSDLAAAWYASRRIPVVGVVERGIDVIADRGIQSPGFAQRRVAQMFGNALTEKGGDIGRCRHVLKLRQAGEIDLLRGIAFGNRPGRRIGIGGRRVAIRLFRLVLALRPSRQKTLVVRAVFLVAHVRPFPSSGEPSGIRWPSLPARSRWRL